MHINFFSLAAIVCVLFSLAVTLCCAQAAAQIPDAAYESCPRDGDPKITALLESIRKKHKVSAICAALINSDGIVAMGAVGVRKIQTDVAVTIADQWHLGSDTKVMTACLVGLLVEEGHLRWDSRMAEVFPELIPTMTDSFKSITLLQLMSHHAGMPSDLDWWKLTSTDSLSNQRYSAVKQAAALKLAAPGSTYSYSNLDYVIAGAVIEKITGQSWEDVIKQRLFAPLNMTSAGFGGTGTAGEIDQPWGHMENGMSAPTNGPLMDNPLLMAPAGGVHCSMNDWAAFITDQLRGALGNGSLLKPETYKMIQSPPLGGDYALGWLVAQRPWGGGTVFTHAGSNTMNFANVWIAPQRDFAVLVCINQGGSEAAKAADEAVGALIGMQEQK